MKSPSIIPTAHEDRGPTVDGLSTTEAEFALPTVDGLSTTEAEFALPTEDKEVEVLECMGLDTEADQRFCGSSFLWIKLSAFCGSSRQAKSGSCPRG